VTPWGDVIQHFDLAGRKIERGSGDVLAQMRERSCAWNRQNVWRSLEQPRERDLHRSGSDTRRNRGERGGFEQARIAQRKMGHVGDTGCGSASISTSSSRCMTLYRLFGVGKIEAVEAVESRHPKSGVWWLSQARTR